MTSTPYFAMAVVRPFVLGAGLLLQALSFVLVGPGAAYAQQPPPTAQTVTVEQLAGNYQLPDGRVVGINPFSGDGGPPSPLFTDYTTGAIRTLVPQQGERFGMGPSLGVQSPIEHTLRVVRSEAGAIAGIALQRPGEDEIIAKRLPADAREVEFTSEDATLAGMLLIPPTPGPHPAIVLLHGSGPLKRYSFGPYTRFFASLGLAVLIYDKRGTGGSTGTFFPRTAFYPEPYLRDAVAAVKFLKTRRDINPRQIGVWGTSEGGMLSTQVAAVENVAFAINSSGFVMPLWEQVLYNIEAQLRADGFSAAEVAEAVKFETLAIEVMRTGNNWDDYQVAQAAVLQTKWWSAYFGSSKGFSSPEDIRWQWEHVYRFDPRPALQAVKCPVLGLFGALDTSTPARRAASNLENGLRAAGNQDVTIRIFEQGNHPLMDARSGGNAEIPSLTRMLPDVFGAIRTWVSSKITMAQ
jgi:pimeloyl-ACP methyl ester carboxylesterase